MLDFLLVLLDLFNLLTFSYIPLSKKYWIIRLAMLEAGLSIRLWFVAKRGGQVTWEISYVEVVLSSSFLRWLAIVRVPIQKWMKRGLFT